MSELGAQVIPIGCSPNGRNINNDCGSTHPEILQLTVPAVKGDFGIALDGDGDRVVMIDEFGQVVDGDQLLYILATDRQREGQLKGPVVGTVMSNLGLERALDKHNIAFRRAPVGDRYVLDMLYESGGIIGGESSGHLICLDCTTTGDGLIAGLQVLAVMKRTGKTLSELCNGMDKYPQRILNVRTKNKLDPSKSSKIQDAIRQAENELADSGRVVLRASGTEPVIRVMIEGEKESQILPLAERLAAVVAEATT